MPDFVEILWNIVYFMTVTNPYTTSIAIIHMHVAWHVAVTCDVISASRDC